jgi:RNA recognition motif-containing protein
MSPVLVQDWHFSFTIAQHTIALYANEENRMDIKLYVGNLSYDTTEEDLRTLFSGAGTVTSVSLIKDRDTGRSKGFAFIEMSSQSEAELAIKSLDGTSMGNREIKVNKARPPEERPYSGYSNRSGKGGYRDHNRRSGKGGSRRY